MAGLSRRLNLSERDVNLKEALQKLDSPGIENDIELFSLSSQVSSLINSGTEDSENSQLIGLASESFKTKVDGSDAVVKRTKFITKDYSFATGNQVYFDTYTLSFNSATDAVNPKFSSNGSISQINIKNAGDGYFFRATNSRGNVVPLTADVTVSGVKLKGTVSGAENAVATVKFAVDANTYTTSNVSTYSISGTSYNAGTTATSIYGSDHDFVINANGSWTYTASGSTLLTSDVIVTVIFANNVTRTYTFVSKEQSTTSTTGSILLPPTNAPAELSAYTDFYTKRFKIETITITNGGSGYIVGENLEVLEGTVTNASNNAAYYLEKQQGYMFSGDNPNIEVTRYLYTVIKGGPNGFYLFDPILNKYIFLNIQKDEDDFTNSVANREIRIARFDGVEVKNIFNLRFAQSFVAIEGHSIRYRAGSQLVGEINSLQDTAERLNRDSELALQNTRLPLPTSDGRNNLGFEFNRFVGKSGTFRQRLIIRDQDYILNPSNAWVTATNLSSAFSSGRRFEVLDSSSNKKRVSGIFIKVGSEYKRAFSTKDKPYLSFNSAGAIANPDIVGGTYAVSASDYDSSGDLYGFNTTIGTLAQRIQPTDLGTSHDAGIDGAFYFHKSTAPTVTTTGSGTNQVWYVPLFRYLP